MNRPGLIALATLGAGGATPALAQHNMSHMDHSAPAPASAPATTDDMAGMDHSGMDHSSASDGGMSGALGDYPASREASGTAWQPDTSEHSGVHLADGEWMVMVHALANAVYDKQAGPRGDEKSFVGGMLMGMARRGFANGDALQFRAMLSPEPLMGRSGYPLLLATGETADGATPLVDRQHPHDLFMELSASYSHRLTAKDSLFVYAGLPGEPAFGPPAFMHRMSIMDSPEAPISHHWLDSTHITFGVLTAGYVHDDWKVEVSRFRGREPNEARYDIETPKLDSTALRLSWNPTAKLSLQGSWAKVKSPEELEPTENQRKWSASAIYTVPVGAAGWWSTTAAYGQRSSGHHQLRAWILESAVKPNAAWTLFGRTERVDNNELVAVATGHGPTFKVGKVSVGAIRDWRLAPHVQMGLGGLYAWNDVPSTLATAYGRAHPQGGMVFLRLKID